MIRRYIEKLVEEDLKEKMVFIGGPRQVGKTTLALEIGRAVFSGSCRYLNWDNRDDKKKILKGAFAGDEKFVIFDELHKYRQWKNFIKGEYDKNRESRSIMVTGSSRLDVFRKGGDSLLGRYHHYRLHPLSLGEVLRKGKNAAKPGQGLVFAGSTGESREIFERLLAFGGFPEIYTRGTVKALKRWHNARGDALIREDIRDMENIRDLSALEILSGLLPGRAGSLFSINSLREDLSVTHKTLSSWVEILERFYYVYRIYSYQTTLIKSLRKEPKLYLWDWSEVPEEGARFENLVASHLLKFCHYLHDAEGHKARLHFIRDVEKREVDFLVTVDNKPWFCVEAKLSDAGIARTLGYFSSKIGIPHSYQVVRAPGVDYIKDKKRVLSADKFLSALV